MVKPVDAINNHKTVKDIYRDTPLRYFGYAGHLAWACRQILPFKLASMASVAYVCADTFDKTSQSALKGNNENKVLATAIDSFVWHFFASFAIPGLMFHGISSVASLLRPPRSSCRSRPHYFLLPCLLSGLAIPIIARPIDMAIDDFMSTHVRKKLHEFLGSIDECENEEVDEKSKTNNKTKKMKWFYDQSRDQNLLDLERHRQKMLEERKEREDLLGRSRWTDKNHNNLNNTKAPITDESSTVANAIQPNQSQNNKNSSSENLPEIATESGMLSKAVQVDKRTKPTETSSSSGGPNTSQS